MQEENNVVDIRISAEVAPPAEPSNTSSLQ